MMRYGIGGMGMLAGGIVGLFITLVLTALVVLAIIALVRYIRHTGRPGHPMPHPFVNPQPANNNDNSALKILDERFAKGEINEEEYTKKKELLRN
jgi:putative membrane protein